MRREVVSTVIVLTVLLLIAVPRPASSAPTIGTPRVTQGSGGQLTVNVTVTEMNPGVQSVMVVYTTDNWSSVNQTVSAPYVPAHDDYEAVISGLSQGTVVSYYVVAVDAGGASSMNNNSGNYYSYTVGSGSAGGGGGGSFNIISTNLWLIAGVLGAVMVGMVVVFKRRSGRTSRAKKQSGA